MKDPRIPVGGRQRSRHRAGLAAAAVAVALGAAGCGAPEGADPAAGTVSPPVDYVGSAACAGCHADMTRAWTGSHHDHALATASDATVLGNFDDASFEYAGVTTTFFRRDGGHWVNTDGPDGELEDFEIVYALGVEPLQQYLVELPGGRVQALSIAWDARPSGQGGQRWFHLYPDEAIDSADPLHWTGPYQRWNTMCADCHSTALEKNFNPSLQTFETAFADVNVGCEACHGPGSRHAADPSAPPPALGRTERVWVFPPDGRIATLAGRGPASAAEPAAEINVCAHCHSRREQLTDDYTPGQPFLDAFRPALLEDGLYHADGQIADEVYVYGSFAQSAMAAAGVICSDCHEPHSARLRAEGNALCSRCHLATAFDTPEHHRHPAGSAGAACVACHMRNETYMVIDPRRDHSFRVPRPDLTRRIGSPNACNDCHSDQTPEWAESRIAAWYPDGRQTSFHFGEALAAGRSWSRDRMPALVRVVGDPEQPAIARATAIGLMAEQLDDPSIDLIATALDDPDPLVRIAALDALAGVGPELRVNLAQRFLTADLRAIRSAAARALLTARSALSARRQADLNAAILEHLEAQQFNADRSEGLLNAATVAATLGRAVDAERTLQALIERDPDFPAAYVNLADLYRSLGREPDAADMLFAGLERNPDDAALNFALGLSLARLDRLDEALARLERAAALAPRSPHYAYARGIALNSAGDTAGALDVLRAAHERFPGHRDTLLGLTTILRDAGELDQAHEYAERFVALVPTDADAQSLLAELESMRARGITAEP